MSGETRRRCSQCSCLSVQAIRTSSVYMNAKLEPQSTWSLELFSVWAAFHKPKGMRRNSSKSNGSVTAVFEMSSGNAVMWQYSGYQIELRGNYFQSQYMLKFCFGCSNLLLTVYLGPLLSGKGRGALVTTWSRMSCDVIAGAICGWVIVGSSPKMEENGDWSAIDKTPRVGMQPKISFACCPTKHGVSHQLQVQKRKESRFR